LKQRSWVEMEWMIRLTSESALRVGRRRRFTSLNYSVLVTDHMQTAEQGSRHLGLIYTARLRADNPQHALGLGEFVSARVADLLSSVHGTAISNPKAHFALAEDGDGVYLAQVMSNAPAIRDPRRAFDADLFDQFFKAMEGLRLSNQGDHSRVERALRCLRRRERCSVSR
jgi:hypothetical protein